MEHLSSKPQESDPREIEQILRVEHPDPFAFLGMHSLTDEKGVVVRVFRPDAVALKVVPADPESGAGWQATDHWSLILVAGTLAAGGYLAVAKQMRRSVG